MTETDFNVLVGKKIVKAEDLPSEKRGTDFYKLTCNDGTIITVETNEGCGACGNGWSSIDDLKVLEDADNAIMNVEQEYVAEGGYDEIFKLFVYYERKEFISIEGDDGYGNGYYGGGFEINLVEVEDEN